MPHEIKHCSFVLWLALGACQADAMSGSAGTAAPASGAGVPMAAAGSTRGAPQPSRPTPVAGQPAPGGQAGSAGTSQMPSPASMPNEPRWEDVLTQTYCPLTCAQTMSLPCYQGRSEVGGCVAECAQHWIDTYAICPEHVPALVRCAASDPRNVHHTCENGRVSESYDQACAAEVQAVDECA